MNYSTLLIQLLPEAVLVVTALVLLGAAVATEAKTGRPFAAGTASAIAAIGVMLAALSRSSAFRCTSTRAAT